MKNILFIGILSAIAITSCSKKEYASFTHQGFDGWKAFNGIVIKKIEHSTEIMIASKIKNPTSAGTTHGAYLIIPKTIAEPFGGGTVLVSFNAKSGDINGSDAIWVTYSTNEVGNSGWRKFKLSKNLTKYSFEYTVLPFEIGGEDYIGFNSDINGGGKTAIIDKVEIQRIN